MLDNHPVKLLSPRETEILQLMVAGLNDGQICNRLVFNHSTCDTHCKSIYNKLGVNDRASAVLLAIQSGLVTAEDIEL